MLQNEYLWSKGKGLLGRKSVFGQQMGSVVQLPEGSNLKGGYLDFSHLTELENTYITEIYMKKKKKNK